MFEQIITSLVEQPANAFTLGIVIVIAIERLVSGGYLKIGKIKNGKKNKQEQLEDNAPDWAKKLMQYVNHDTTNKLKDIKNQAEENGALLHKIHNTLEEFDKYGIKVRNGDKNN